MTVSSGASPAPPPAAVEGVSDVLLRPEPPGGSSTLWLGRLRNAVSPPGSKTAQKRLTSLYEMYSGITGVSASKRPMRAFHHCSTPSKDSRVAPASSS